jgi:hypothetical protein
MGGVLLDRALRFIAVRGETVRQDEGVFDTLASALSHVRQHRVGSVAQERHPPARPCFERWPVK